MINTPVVFTNDHVLLESNDMNDSSEVIYSLICNNAASFAKLDPSVTYPGKIIPERNYCFSLYLDFTNDNGSFNNEIIEAKEILMRCFFHPQYRVKHNRPLICLGAKVAQKDDVQKTIRELEMYAISQGYDGLEVLCFSDENVQGVESIDFSTILSLEEISIIYLRLLKQKYYCGKYIGINYKNVQQVMHKIAGLENELLKKEPDLYHHLNEHRSLNEEILRLNEKKNTIEKELSDQKKYLKIYQDLDESTKIMDFYKYEYEILPAWYKKVGHILKVLMGKRTFRSLFDNDVKKYKD